MSSVLLPDFANFNMLVTSFLIGNVPDQHPELFKKHIFQKVLVCDRQYLSWIPPDQSSLKCNVDGSFFSRDQKAFVSLVLRDSLGVHVYSQSKTVIKSKTHIAEYCALTTALDLAKKSSCRSFLFESDSTYAVDLFNSSKFKEAEMFGIECVHVKREQNRAADYLSRIAKDGDYHSDEGCFPAGFQNILQDDLMNLFTVRTSKTVTMDNDVFAYSMVSNCDTDPLLSLLDKVEVIRVLRGSVSATVSFKIKSSNGDVHLALNVDVHPLLECLIDVPINDKGNKNNAYAFQQLSWLMRQVDLPSKQSTMHIELRSINEPSKHHLLRACNDNLKCPSVRLSLGRLRTSRHILIPEVIVSTGTNIKNLPVKRFKESHVTLDKYDIFKCASPADGKSSLQLGDLLFTANLPLRFGRFD